MVRLRGGGWALETISDDNGYYYFKGLGTDNVFLNLALPEGSGLTPIVTDLALRTKGSGQLVVHLGFYTGPTMPGLPVDITMSAVPESVVPGDTVLYTIQVVNSLPHSLSQVLVTDSLPESLIPVEATVSPFRKTPTPTSTPTNTPTPATPTATPTPGPPTATPRPLPPTATPTPTSLPPTIEIWGNLVIADIGEMAVGDKAVVTIKARVGDNAMPGTVIQNQAYFIYAENVAVQALASLAIGGVLPTGTPTTEVLAVAALPTETPAIAAAPTVMATPGTPDGLPVTGFSLPVAGILLALLVLIVRLLRPRPADET